MEKNADDAEGDIAMDKLKKLMERDSLPSR